VHHEAVNVLGPVVDLLPRRLWKLSNGYVLPGDDWHFCVARDPDELAQAYWENYRLSTSTVRQDRLKSDEYFWAWEEIGELVDERPDESVAVLIRIADAAPDDRALAYLGAGPVETLITSHGSQGVMNQGEDAARRNENFRKALRCAWYDDHVSPDVRARLRVFGEPY
jgi:hypothetical protein